MISYNLTAITDESQAKRRFMNGMSSKLVISKFDNGYKIEIDAHKCCKQTLVPLVSLMGSYPNPIKFITLEEAMRKALTICDKACIEVDC